MSLVVTFVQCSGLAVTGMFVFWAPTTTTAKTLAARSLVSWQAVRRSVTMTPATSKSSSSTSRSRLASAATYKSSIIRFDELKPLP